MSDNADVTTALKSVDDCLWAAERTKAPFATVPTADLQLLMRFTATLARRHREHIAAAAQEAEREVSP